MSTIFASAVRAAIERPFCGIRKASSSEKEVERLLKAMLPHTPWAGKLHAVGGYVRDEYLREITKDTSIEPKDLDIVVDSPKGGGAEHATHFISQFLNKAQPGVVTSPHQMGEAYPIWQLTFKGDVKFHGEDYGTSGAVIEFADSQKEMFPNEKSRQRVTTPGTIEDDVMRRDFTVNMLLKDLTTGEIKDLTGRSKSDIEKGILAGHPKVSLDKMFSDDPLRMIRLVRFRAKYGWAIPEDVKAAVKRNADRLKIISAERITGELKKIAEYGKLRDAMQFMEQTGLLDHVMPELRPLQKTQQSEKWHQEGDVYTHTMMVLQNAGPGLHRQLAALLHDIGKPGATEELEGEIKSHGHADVGGEIAEAIMRRLRFDNDDVAKVKKLVVNHMRPHSLAALMKKGKLTDKALRRFIRDVGDETVDAVLELAEADELGRIPGTHDIPDLRKRIDEVRKSPIQIKKKPILNGKEIMDALGIKQGPEVGKATAFLTDLEDDYAEKNKELTKEEALAELKRQYGR